MVLFALTFKGVAMTPQRAQEILALSDWSGFNCLGFGNIKPEFEPETAAERKEVCKVWDTMPGYTCYRDALLRIINGAVNL